MSKNKNKNVSLGYSSIMTKLTFITAAMCFGAGVFEPFIHILGIIFAFMFFYFLVISTSQKNKIDRYLSPITTLAARIANEKGSNVATRKKLIEEKYQIAINNRVDVANSIDLGDEYEITVKTYYKLAVNMLDGNNKAFEIYQNLTSKINQSGKVMKVYKFFRKNIKSVDGQDIKVYGKNYSKLLITGNLKEIIQQVGEL